MGARGGSVRVLHDPPRHPPRRDRPVRRRRDARRRAGRGASRGGSSCAGSRRRSATRSSTRRRCGCSGSSTAASRSATARCSTALRAAAGDALAQRRGRRGELPPLELGSPSSAAFGPSAARSTRQPFIAPVDAPDARASRHLRRVHRLARHRTREGVRRDARQLATAFGERLRSRSCATPPSSTGSSRAPTASRRSTYQRALGAGFADTPEQRALAASRPRARLGPRLPPLARREPDRVLALLGLRGHDAAPDRRLRPRLLRVPRRDLPAHARDRGRLRRPASTTLDFGPGDAAYKQQFSNREPTTSGTSSSSPPPSAAGGSTRPAPRSSRRHGSARAALDAAGLTDASARLAAAASVAREDLDGDPARADDARSALRDLRYGRPLGGTIRTRYAHLGAFHVDQSPYAELDVLFAGGRGRPGRRDRRRRLRQGPLAQLVPRPLPGNRIYGIELDPEICARRRTGSAARRTSRSSAATPRSCSLRTARSSTSSTRSTGR